jgi:hypothetical protein
MLLAVSACACGSTTKPPTLAATSHPSDELATARYVSITKGDLPSDYKAVSSALVGTDVAGDTLAVYRCEGAAPPSGPAPLSHGSSTFTNPSGETEVHETTVVFHTDATASLLLALEESPRYSGCKASVFKAALEQSAPKGERVGLVTVHVKDIPAKFGDDGVEVEGLANLTLPDQISVVSTSDLVVLVRGRIGVELSVETVGAPPTQLLDKLTDDLAARLAQVVPKS